MGTPDSIDPAPPPGPPTPFEGEHWRAHDRRVHLRIPRPEGAGHTNWALAFSGGGIRSATFCLGVMQGLARCAVPSAWKEAKSLDPQRTDALLKTAAPVQHDNLLRQFDFLSTVSGGGYIGSFFVSLFGKHRLDVKLAPAVARASSSRDPKTSTSPAQVTQSAASSAQTNSHSTQPPASIAASQTPANVASTSSPSAAPNTAPSTPDDLDAAALAFKVFKSEPPGRLHSDMSFQRDTPGAAPLAWLRENGRYMAPTGSGDFVYAVSLGIRNWCAVHYVLGTVLLLSFLTLALTRASLVQLSFGAWWPWKSYTDYAILRYHDYELNLLLAVTTQNTTKIWWSPIWWFALPLFEFWIVPSAIAFWLTHPKPTGNISDRPRWNSRAAVATLLGGMLMLLVWWAGHESFGTVWYPVTNLCAAVGAAMILGFFWHLITHDVASISAHRVALTHDFANGLTALAIVCLLAAVDTLAQSLYIHVEELSTWMSPGAIVAAIVWTVRRLASAFDEKERTGWLRKIPLNAIIGFAGAVLLLLVALLWALLALYIRWRGAPPEPGLLLDSAVHWQMVQVVFYATLLALMMALITGLFPGFLNLSTLQGLYSARLTRAYFGASNGRRFADMTGLDEKEKAKQRAQHSVAEPAPGDSMMPRDYYANRCAPMHIVNVCLNQNIDPGEQLVQRDRKGKPLAVLPGGYTIERDFIPVDRETEDSRPRRAGELYANLTMGEWVGVSGAAFSTGMGRRSSIGFSLLMGLSNVRLGRWWSSGTRAASPRSIGKMVRAMFRTQTYLFDELLSRFHGTRRSLHYLSDGGHYENTAVYELVRPERKVRLIVVCDCGCDPKYELEDLANLVRLARIDFKAEVEVDAAIELDPIIGKYFTTPDKLRADYLGVDAGSKCAMLLNVHCCADADTGSQLQTRIVLLKPRLIKGLPADLAQYRDTCPAFPQEPTADQFYDEAQWESYRKLGLEIASAVFGAQADDAYRERLWAYLLQDLPTEPAVGAASVNSTRT